MIVAIDAPKNYNSSDSIVVCREFIEKSFETCKNDRIKFESLGPSPFHINFILRPLEDKNEFNEPLTFEIKHSRGYDELLGTYDPEVFEDQDRLLDYLMFMLDTQIGFFYKVTHWRLTRYIEWANFQETLEEILEKQKEKGLRAFWRNMFRGGELVNSTRIKLAEMEAGEVIDTFDFKKELKDLYIGEKAPELLPYIEKSFGDLGEIPFSQTKEILDLLEKQNNKRLSYIMMVVSAVLGGGIGAWLTLLFKGL
jgi:hypothetical protein